MPNSPSSLSDRLRAAADKANKQGTGNGYAPQQKTATQAKQQVHEDVSVGTGAELKIKDNPFYQTLTDPQSTQEDKISAIAAALNPKAQPMDKLQANFRAFQEYYTFVQSEELEEALENIQRLMKELENNTKIEVAAILKSLQGMLNDVKESRDLVEILRQSRITGKTIEELSAAVARNEQIVKRLGDLDVKRKAAVVTVNSAKSIVDARIEERNAASKKFGARLLGLIKKDTTMDDRVASASIVADSSAKGLAAVDQQIAELTGERRKDLESGPLKILRSLDEADDNLTERLLSSGHKGIDTIQDAQRSVLQLMQRALFSEGEVDKISRRVSDKQITLTVLKSGLADASKNTNEFKDGLQQQSDKAEGDLTAAKAGATGVLDVAKKETDAINVRANIGEVIDYQSRLNDTITEMNVTLSKNIERQGETDRQKGIVQGTKKSITILGRDTLNTVAGNLEGVLHNLVADQTDETQQAIVAFSRAAEDVKHGSMESMMERQKEMHDKDMTLLDDTIGRLNTSSEMIAKALETSVDEGIARADKQRQLAAATSQLESATTTMRTVVGKMSNESVQERPTQK